MSTDFDSWAIVELMGHVRMAGRVTEEERFGAKVGRIDVPRDDDGYTTVFFGGSSIYRLTPTTETIARAVAKSSQPRPVRAFELPAPAPAPAGSGEPDEWRCRVCGCTEDNACDGGCEWVEPNLCSACAE